MLQSCQDDALEGSCTVTIKQLYRPWARRAAGVGRAFGCVGVRGRGSGRGGSRGEPGTDVTFRVLGGRA